MKAAFRVCAIVAVAVALSGCRTGEDNFPRIVNEPMPVPSAQRSSFGVIGILPADIAANFEFGRPASPLEAAGNIGGKTFVALAESSMESDEGRPGRQLEDLAMSAALGSAIGVLGGLLAGVPEGDVKRAQSAMNQALQDNPLEPGIQAQLEHLAVKGLFSNFLPVSGTALATVKGNTSAKENLRALAGCGVDSVMLLHADNERFVPGEGLNPPMSVEIDLRVQIIRIADGQVLFDQTLEYQGNRQPFTRWGENDAKLFRAELEAAQRTFATAIFDELSD